MTESARMSSAAEARFRLRDQRPTGRVVKVDPPRPRHRCRSERDGGGRLRRDGDGGRRRTARAAATIGEVCSRRRITTATVVVRGPSATDEMLSTTLAQVRPWSLMVVVAGDESYLDDLLKSFR